MVKVILLIFCLCPTVLFAGLSKKHFPVDHKMRKRVNFWEKVYSQINSDEGFLHDEHNLGIIYETVSVRGLSRRNRRRKVKARKRRWKKIILSIIKGKPVKVNEDLLFKLQRLPKKKLRKMARRIRYQGGMSNRYLQGLAESYKYLEQIKKSFREKGHPEQLAYLPHVESSFNYQAYSKVGAAGIWQFMRSTGRLYKLKRNYLIDERRDPVKSTKAAVRLLGDNYRRFKTWPLALTAYNYGPKAMDRAVRKMKTKNISKIVENYNGRRFRFASKNFYATFVAASEISENPKKFFKKIRRKKLKPFTVLKLPNRMPIKKISRLTKIGLRELQSYNLALRPAVFRRNLALPRNFQLKIPEVSITRKKKLMASIGTYRAPKRVKRKPKPKLRHGFLERMAKINRPILKWLKSLDFSGEEKQFAVHLPLDVVKSYDLDLKRVKNNLYRVSIEPEETLGHYADWSLVPVRKILKYNRKIRSKSIRLGGSIIIPLDIKNIKRFKRKRREYHLSIQEDFFNNYKIDGIKKYHVKRGDTLDRIKYRMDVPIWLLRYYQKDDILRVGDMLEVPKIVSVSES
ncbi:MAG: lytic transglycosylase [Deltaproteobacteria bacterium]|nr:MAG: lytic transglycosylase [Deltaproteobacteria bacterium]